MRGASGGTGANITFTFQSNVDTTTLQPGQAFNLRTYLFSQGIIRSLDITTRLNIIIPSGVTISSSDSTKAALTLAGFKDRDTITINNQGNIYGAGGNGGLGGYQTKGSDGTIGGDAIVLSSGKCFINNTGIIGSGGGGSGGAGGTMCTNCGSTSTSTDRECGGCTQWANFQCRDFISCRSTYTGSCNGNTVRGGTSGGQGPWFDFYYYVFKTCTDTTTTYYNTYGTGAAGSTGTAGSGQVGNNGAANNYGAGLGRAAGNYIKGMNFLYNTVGGTLRGNTTAT